MTEMLAGAGYHEARLIPVGLGYAHGFAIATRLERVGPGGSPYLDAERWSPAFPGAPEMRWLVFASGAPMPREGRYRTLLVSFSDLPLYDPHRPPIENEGTVMDGPDVPRGAPLPARRFAPGYRVSLHVYGFEGAPSVKVDDARASEPAAATAARVGLGGL
ncbi:MAG TPA: hypothetical protein VIY73_24340 [Polyangiaceae bacterium]